VEESVENRAVVIEDNEEVASLIEKTLASSGFSVMRVEANDKVPLEIQKIMPKVILLSSDVPKGFTICHKIKKDPSLRKIPLILLSERASFETLKKHMALPTRADFYLKKPFGEEILRGTLKNLGFALVEDVGKQVDIPDRTLYQPSIQAQAIASYVEEEVSSMKSMLAKLEQEKSMMQKKVMELEKELAEERRRVNGVLASVSKERDFTRLEQLEMEIEKAREAARKETEAVVEALKKEVERLRTELAQAKKAEEEAKAKLLDTSGLFQTLEAGYKDAMEMLEMENRTLREQVDLARAEVMALQERLAEIAEKEKSFNILREMASRAESLEKEVARLREEKEALVAEAREMRESLAKAKVALERIEELEKENRQLREEMGRAKAALKKESEMRENAERACEALKNRLDQIRQLLGIDSTVIKDEG